MTSIVASVGGDIARWILYAAVMPAVLVFWYILLSGFGTSDSAGLSRTSFRNQPGMLADERFAPLHKFIKWAVAACMLALIAECTFILPYVVIRFGWSR